jgi:hypothetical protein
MISPMDSRADRSARREVWLVAAVTAVGVACRLVSITQPFVDVINWRQAETAMVAENFYKHGFHVFYPQINWAGTTGYVGMELQLFPLFAALLYTVFGVQDWIGRALALVSFAASVPFFYLLVKKVADVQSALFAAAIYALVPLSIVIGRSFMPDMPSLAFSIAALYFFSEYLECESVGMFAATCIALALAVLEKLPAVIIGLPFVYMAWARYGRGVLYKKELWALAILSLILPAAWYYHTYRVSSMNYPYFFFGASGFRIVGFERYMRVLDRTVFASLTPIVAALMIVGLFIPFSGRFRHLFHWWFAAMLLFIVFAGDGNARHRWYQLPLVPVAAALAGRACDAGLRLLARRTNVRAIAIAASALFFAALGYQSYQALRPIYTPWALPGLNAGLEVDRLAPPDALVISATDGDPTMLYYSRRKGWHFPPMQGEELALRGDGRARTAPWPTNGRQAIDQIETFHQQGASYLIFTQDTFYYLRLTGQYSDLQKHLDGRYRRIRETNQYIIFDLANGRAN